MPSAAASAPAPAPGAAPGRVTPWLAAHWGWLAGALALLLAHRVWRARFSAYDRSGLPRGPRL